VTTAAIESTENSQGLAPFLDTLVVDHRCWAREMDAGVLGMALPVGSAPPLHEDVGPKRRSGHLDARWVPDPLGEQGLICIWVHRTGEESSAPDLDPQLRESYY
jgi:hypothetical protein